MNDNISSLWASHFNIVARNRFRHNQRVFFSCVTVLILSGFVALLMIILTGCCAGEKIKAYRSERDVNYMLSHNQDYPCGEP